MNLLNFKKASSTSYLAVGLLGRSLKLNIKYITTSNVTLEREKNELNLFLPKSHKNIDNSEVIDLSIQKLYDTIAAEEIENAMEIARYILKFAPEDYIITRFNGICKATRDKVILINPDIVRYSREIIITTLIQNFCKVKYKANSNLYKETLTIAMKKYEDYKSAYLTDIALEA